MEMSARDYSGPTHQCAGPGCIGSEHKGENPEPTDVFSVYQVKDSGARQTFESGMVRDTSLDKLQWHRTADGPMQARWAEHMTKGATKYPDNPDGSPNWTLANGRAEYVRFRQSAFRHFMQWYNGQTDEDHAAAVFFNINGAEYVKSKL